MCFSASSSFTATFFLISIGALALSRIKDKSQILLASIPFLFGIQQAFEGIVWLTISDPNCLAHKISAFLFLIFAMVVWPIYIPISLGLIETGIRRIVLFLLSLFGVAISVYLLYFIIINGITTVQIKNSIFYNIGKIVQFPPQIDVLIYCIPTILPFFISRIKYTKIAGVSIFLSMIVAYYVKEETFGSIWCFFAALLSMFILFLIRELNEESCDDRSTIDDIV